MFASFGSHVYLWKSTHVQVQIIFNPELTFQLGYRKPGWKFKPWGKLSPRLKILSFNTKIKNSWFLRYHGMKFQPWCVIKISAQGWNIPSNEPLNVHFLTKFEDYYQFERNLNANKFWLIWTLTCLLAIFQELYDLRTDFSDVASETQLVI